MPKITLEIGSKQIMNIIRELPVSEKIELTRMLEEEVFVERFRNLLNSLKKSAQGVSITMDEIVDEVEVVRKARYEGRH